MDREREEYGPPARREDYRPEPYVPIAVPLPRSRALPPPRIYAERDYDEIRIQEPGRYGNEEYHTYPERVREKEVIRERTHRDSSRARSHRGSTVRTLDRVVCRLARQRAQCSQNPAGTLPLPPCAG